jgi:predicted transcriptional regulator
MTLTVRLDNAIESALERYCAEHGITKSLAVQESLAAYLWRAQPASASAKGAASAVFEALTRAGLIGAGELGGAVADKKSVRARAMQRARRTAGA